MRMPVNSGLIPPASVSRAKAEAAVSRRGPHFYARDRQGPKFAFQHLIYPMIDDRSAVRKDLHPYVGEFVSTQENNYFGWRSLRNPLSPYWQRQRSPPLGCVWLTTSALITSHNSFSFSTNAK